jgi:phosphatidylserine/phosphatidylglycerophosphate/cardiolipin synthase-like enzyme
LPAKDVKVVLDREYFEVARGLLKNAEKSIQMMMFEANFYADHPGSPSNILIGELISARKRGIKVEVILESNERGDRTAERNRLTGRMLSKEGVEVIYDPVFVTTHAKLIIIDERISLLGSTNWTYYSLTSNHEVGVLIESREVAQALGYYFDRVKNSGHR